MKIQRYSFEDALIKWGAHKGRKEKAAVSMGLMLCSQLNWSKGGVLRWKTSNALEAIGVSRSTFYRTMPILVDAGWFYLDKQRNYRVRLLSHDETESHDETQVSHDETNKSHEDNPFSEVSYLVKEEEESQEEDQAQETLSLDELVRQTSSVRDDFSLDDLQPFTLISKPARVGHKEKDWMERAQDRQAQINAEILAEMENQ